MNKIVMFFISIFCAIGLFGCSGNNNLSQPKTNLEFWIGDNVDDVDFSKYQMKYGMFGGYEYYGTGYVPTLGEEGQQVDPEYCVLYTVTSYPDYSSKSKHVTRIHITDPNIELYGLSITSTEEDIRCQMEEKMGFDIEKIEDTDILVATKGKYTFKFSSKSILITVDVTNFFGIQF